MARYTVRCWARSALAAISRNVAGSVWGKGRAAAHTRASWSLVSLEHHGRSPPCTRPGSVPHQRAGHMTAPDQCCINVKKLLSIRRRPHMTHSRPRPLARSRREFVGFVGGTGDVTTTQPTHGDKVGGACAVCRHDQHSMIRGRRIKFLAAGSAPCASLPDQATTAARPNTVPRGFLPARSRLASNHLLNSPQADGGRPS